jgi:nitronate monooxygenase
VAVIAAGGIMDGRGMAAAQALGAQAVQMGTAFLACPESGIGPAYRAALARADATQTRITRSFSGRPARGIANAMMARLQPLEDAWPAYPVHNALMGPVRRAAAEVDDGDYLALWAGQGVAAARAFPAATLVQELAREWQAARKQMQG